MGAMGALPLVLLSCSLGVAAVAGADALSRTGRPYASVLFWVGATLIVLPAVLRMAFESVGAGERIATVIAVTLALYSIKVLRDPFSFTYADEFPHFFNLQQILRTGHLFNSNSILPITPRYPGLEAVAAALARLSGASPFACSLVLIGVARVVLLVALYLFYERVSRSSRTAAIGALVYTATPTFLFWSSQFSYDSLALPLATTAMFGLMRWGQSRDVATRRRWAALMLVLGAAVVPTHHITSYVLALFVGLVCVSHWLMRGRRGAPWRLALVLTLLALAWLAFVADGTVGYLRPEIATAVNKVLQTLRGESSTRVLFANQGGPETTPLSEEVVALIGILLLGLCVLAGTRVAWLQRRQRNPVLAVLVVAALAYLLTLPLRFVAAAWETASRAGEFLFIGVGLTVAIGLVAVMDRRQREGQARWRGVASVIVALIFASGVIAGWPASLRLAEPLEVTAAGHTLKPPQYVAAQWSGRELGRAPVVAAQPVDARLFLVDGHQTAYAGTFPDVQGLLNARTVGPWRPLLRRYRITLVESDLRDISTDIIAGYFFNPTNTPLAPAVQANKFNLPNVNRLYSAGDIVIWGVRGLW
jgi:hypothetical protein